MNVFGVGAGEALLVVVIALLLVGPNRFPEIARQAGRYYRLARRYTDEVMTDVRAAVKDLEDEVGSPADDLRSIREIGSELTSDLTTARQDIEQIGRDTEAAAAGTAVADEATSATAAGVAAEDGPSVQTMPLPAAEEPSSPVSIRPSKRAPGSVDPFEALEAKRARERERGGPDNGHK